MTETALHCSFCFCRLKEAHLFFKTRFGDFISWSSGEHSLLPIRDGWCPLSWLEFLILCSVVAYLGVTPPQVLEATYFIPGLGSLFLLGSVVFSHLYLKERCCKMNKRVKVWREGWKLYGGSRKKERGEMQWSIEVAGRGIRRCRWAFLPNHIRKGPVPELPPQELFH